MDGQEGGERKAEVQKEKRARGAGQRIIGLLAFVAAFVVVKQVSQNWSDAESMNNVGAAASRQMAEMRAKAEAEHPDKPIALAVQEEALNSSVQSLAQASDDKKADMAAGQFIGFYLINVRSRREYCRELGVDISPFIDEFVAGHRDLYAKSRGIHARSPYTPDKIEAGIFEQLRPTFKKTIAEAMTTFALMNSITERDVCEAFALNGKELADEMHLSNVNPALYQVLDEAK